MFPKVSIIILNWNGVTDTLECLESLKKIDYPNYEVIIVDNNSSGDDVKVIKENFGGFVNEIIGNKNNLGFSGGNNVGIRYAIESGADFVLLLNNDTIVEADFLDKLLEKKDCQPNIGILTPMITFYSNRNIIWSAGGYISKIRSSGFSYAYKKKSTSFMNDRFCSFATGCCMLIKKEVIEKVGLLDEKYFLYLEDTDYCQRAVKEGYKILYTAASRVYHKVFSTTAKENSLLPTYYSLRNRLYFAKKNFGQFFYITFVYVLLVSSFKIISNIYNQRYAKVIFRSLKDFFNNNLGKTNYFDNSKI